jgi:hypothetical protein
LFWTLDPECKTLDANRTLRARPCHLGCHFVGNWHRERGVDVPTLSEVLPIFENLYAGTEPSSVQSGFGRTLWHSKTRCWCSYDVLHHACCRMGQQSHGAKFVVAGEMGHTPSEKAANCSPVGLIEAREEPGCGLDVFVVHESTTTRSRRFS